MADFAEKQFNAVAEALPEILAWVEEQTMSMLPLELALKIQLVAEEAVVNVVSYAYAEAAPDKEKTLTLRLGKNDNTFFMDVTDSGKPFNPLENNNSDAKQEFEEREPGGWGIAFLVEMTDKISYEYVNGQNRLHIEKNLSDGGADK